MAVLADITRSITAALDLDILLQRIVEGARDLCASDTAAIFLRDGDSEAMVPRCRVGPWLEQYRALRIHPGQGLGGEVIVGGKPARTTHYLGDPRMPEDFRPIARETGTIALLVVPIAIGSRVEGLLYIANREARSFTDVDEAISLRLADQAAIALRNATVDAIRLEAEQKGLTLRTTLDPAAGVVCLGRLASEPITA